MDTPLTKNAWISRCAAHFRTVAGLEETVAARIAEACWKNALLLLGSESAVLDELPEDVADDEMFYWGGD